MYFDKRLWGYTEGVRLRIFSAVAIGILSVLFGIARLALLGWLIALIFRGTPLDQLILPVLTVAGAMVVRGSLEYLRTMVAHNTAAKLPRDQLPTINDKSEAISDHRCHIFFHQTARKIPAYPPRPVPLGCL